MIDGAIELRAPLWVLWTRDFQKGSWSSLAVCAEIDEERRETIPTFVHFLTGLVGVKPIVMFAELLRLFVSLLARMGMGVLDDLEVFKVFNWNVALED